MLKLVRCVLPLHSWKAIVGKVSQIARGMTVWKMDEDSPETNRRASYRGLEFEVALPSIVIEIVTDDSWLDDVIARVSEAHRSGEICGRHLQVFPVEESYRIRDGFMDTG